MRALNVSISNEQWCILAYKFASRTTNKVLYGVGSYINLFEPANYETLLHMGWNFLTYIAIPIGHMESKSLGQLLLLINGNGYTPFSISMRKLCIIIIDKRVGMCWWISRTLIPFRTKHTTWTYIIYIQIFILSMFTFVHFRNVVEFGIVVCRWFPLRSKIRRIIFGWLWKEWIKVSVFPYIHSRNSFINLDFGFYASLFTFTCIVFIGYSYCIANNVNERLWLSILWLLLLYYFERHNKNGITLRKTMSLDLYFEYT